MKPLLLLLLIENKELDCSIPSFQLKSITFSNEKLLTSSLESSYRFSQAIFLM